MTDTVDLASADARARSRPSCAAGDRFLLTAHEGPDGDALGSLLGMHKVLTQLGKDSIMFMAAKEFPLPIEYRFLPLEEVFHEPPADMADRTVIFLDCGNIDRMPVDFLTSGGNRVINIDHHHDNTRFGDVNLVEVERLLHGGDRLRPGAAARGRDHPGPGGRALRRADHRHRQVHVREHQRPHPPGRGGADRRRGRRRRHLPPPLRARADREAEAGRAGAGGDLAPLRRPARHLLHHRGRLRRDRRRRGDDRGRDRPPALDRGDQGRGGDPRPRQPRPRRPQGQPALAARATSTSRRSPASRAAAATNAPPASRPTSSYDELVAFLCGEVVAQLGD